MTPRPWGWVSVLLWLACGSRPAEPVPEVTQVRHVDRAVGGSASVPLAGERCKGRRSCLCRLPGHGDDEETEAPAAGLKRFEIRLGADGGSAALDSPALGHFEADGPQEACFYVDVPAGQTSAVTFVARAGQANTGVSPRLRLTEYGPKGPYWYTIMEVECRGPQGRCDRQGVDTWAARTVNQRKRGRLDPCGSAVISQLKWDTTGGQSDREGGLYRDITVQFALEVKKFATQFAPGSTECVPK